MRKLYKKKFTNTLKAKTMLDVLRETGELQLKEAYLRLHPECAPSSVCNATRDFVTPDVYAEFIRMLRADNKSVENLDNSKIISSILSDIELIDKMLESDRLSVDDIGKLINTKTAKQKLLGSFLGIWNAEKETVKDSADPDKLFQQGTNLLKGIIPS